MHADDKRPMTSILTTAVAAMALAAALAVYGAGPAAATIPTDTSMVSPIMML